MASSAVIAKFIEAESLTENILGHVNKELELLAIEENKLQYQLNHVIERQKCLIEFGKLLDPDNATLENLNIAVNITDMRNMNLPDGSYNQCSIEEDIFDRKIHRTFVIDDEMEEIEEEEEEENEQFVIIDDDEENEEKNTPYYKAKLSRRSIKKHVGSLASRNGQHNYWIDLLEDHFELPIKRGTILYNDVQMQKSRFVVKYPKALYKYKRRLCVNEKYQDRFVDFFLNKISIVNKIYSS